MSMVDGSDVSVCLSASRFDQHNSQMQGFDIPICVVQIGIGMFGFDMDLEHQQHELAEICKKMVDVVEIDSVAQTVLIKEKETGAPLVEYKVEKPSIYNDAFFKRWNAIHCMLFEYQAISLPSENCMFALKGIYKENKWVYLEISPSTTIHIKTLHGFGG